MPELKVTGIARLGSVDGPYTATIDGEWVLFALKINPGDWQIRIPVRDLAHMFDIGMLTPGKVSPPRVEDTKCIRCGEYSPDSEFCPACESGA